MAQPSAKSPRKANSVTSGATTKATEVLASHSDPRSGYSYPSHWQILDGSGKVIGWTKLSQITINGGVAKNLFEAKVPEGYTATP